MKASRWPLARDWIIFAWHQHDSLVQVLRKQSKPPFLIWEDSLGTCSIHVHEDLDMERGDTLFFPTWFILVIHTPRTEKFIIYRLLTAVYRNTLVRVHQSHGQCKEWRKCPMGKSHRNHPNEEILSRFSIWLLFFKDMFRVRNPTFGQLQRKCPLIPHIHQKFKQEEMDDPSTLSQLILRDCLFIF